MIVVPDKKILAIPTKERDGCDPFNVEEIPKFLRPLNVSKKRNWFNSHFYKCLPLSIGNMQGFSVSLPFDTSVYWNGGNTAEDIVFQFSEEELQFINKWHITISSHFGNGIFTVHLPLILKTPPMINLMTIAPPNYPLPGLSPMTGVVEADNLRYSFGINIKIDIPDVWINIEKDYPLAAIIPIPRYFCDDFDLVTELPDISKEDIEEERGIASDHDAVRPYLSSMNKQDRSYFSGMDIHGNKFSDHQLPTKKIVNNDY